jgi:hypothetical protein
MSTTPLNNDTPARPQQQNSHVFQPSCAEIAREMRRRLHLSSEREPRAQPQGSRH